MRPERETASAIEHPSIGIDLLEIERLERALERRPRLAERLFTAGERRYAAARARPGQHLAARFCAKEAVAKALGLTAWSFREVEVVSDGGRRRSSFTAPSRSMPRASGSPCASR